MRMFLDLDAGCNAVSATGGGSLSAVLEEGRDTDKGSLLVRNLNSVLALVTGKTSRYNDPGHGSRWLIANLFSVNRHADRAFDV